MDCFSTEEQAETAKIATGFSLLFSVLIATSKQHHGNDTSMVCFVQYNLMRDVITSPFYSKILIVPYRSISIFHPSQSLTKSPIRKKNETREKTSWKYYIPKEIVLNEGLLF